jgi:hypothetical protein
MANTFRNATGQADTVGVTIYTVPAATTSILIGATMANITGGVVTASLQLDTVYIVRDATIPVGSSLSVLDGKIVLQTGDTIVATASANTSVDIILSLLEIT